MSYDFDGVDDVITATVPAFNDNWTIGAWIFPDTVGEGGLGRLIQIDNAGTGRSIFQLEATATFTAQQDTTGGPNADSTAPNNTLTLGAWNLVFAVHRNSDRTIRLYHGSLTTPVSEVSSYTTQVAGVGTNVFGTDANIGNRSALDRTFDGRIERFVLVSAELSLNEMEQFRQGDWWAIYSSALKAYWPLDSPFGVVYDHSGNEAHGTVSGPTIAEGPPVAMGSITVMRPSVFEGTGSTATPGALTVAVTLPAVAPLADSTITAPSFTVATTMPAPTITATGVAAPAALTVPITIPQVSASGSGSTALPPVLSVPITLPAPTLQADAVATPDTIEVGISIPQVTNLATVNVVPEQLTVGITFEAPTITGNIPGTAAPNPLTVSVSIPAFSTVSEIATFSSQLTELEDPPVLPSSRGLQRSLFRHYRSRPSGVNLFLMKDGTVTTNDPTTTYNADGTINEEAWSRVQRVFWGGLREAEQITDAEAAALTTAGYTLGQDAIVGA